MNKTQKGAWYSLVTTFLCFAIFGYVFLEISILQRLPEGFSKGLWLLAGCLFLGASLVFLRRKQSPTEVDSDERDNLIKSRAVLASFISVWILLYASTVIPWFVVGREGSIPVFLLPLINVGILLVVILIYSVAILIQYGWGGKDGEK